MRKIFLMLVIIIIGFSAQAQTDLKIVNAIIGKPISELSQLLDNLGLEYYITSDNEYILTLFIAKNNSVRLWEIKHKNLFRTVLIGNSERDVLAGKDLIVEVFVRYRHANINDLKEFHAYEVPESTAHRSYDKSGGAKVSHLKVIQY